MEGREKELGPFWNSVVLQHTVSQYKHRREYNTQHCMTVQCVQDICIAFVTLHCITSLDISCPCQTIPEHWHLLQDFLLEKGHNFPAMHWHKSHKRPCTISQKIYVIATNDIRHTHTHNEENVHKITNICMYKNCIFCTYRLWTSASVS